MSSDSMFSKLLATGIVTICLLLADFNSDVQTQSAWVASCCCFFKQLAKSLYMAFHEGDISGNIVTKVYTSRIVTKREQVNTFVPDPSAKAAF